jgi:hypothetical protein
MLTLLKKSQRSRKPEPPEMFLELIAWLNSEFYFLDIRPYREELERMNKLALAPYVVKRMVQQCANHFLKIESPEGSRSSMPEYKDVEGWIKKTAEEWIKGIEEYLSKVKPKKREKCLYSFRQKVEYLLGEKLKDV